VLKNFFAAAIEARVKVKYTRVHSLKAYGGRGGGTALILNLSNRWWGGHPHVSPKEAPVLARRAAWIGAFIRGKNLLSLSGIEPQFLDLQSVA